MATDVNGCQQYTEALVVVNPLPTASINGSYIICFGESTTLNATGGISYIWSDGKTTDAIIVAPTTNTIYSVSVTDSNGCSANSSRTVIVNPLPIPVINGNSSFCTGTSSVLTAIGGISYVWSNGATGASITINPGLSTFYTVTVTDTNGCTATASRMANVMELPIASISGNSNICKGSSTVLSAEGGVLFLWSNGNTSSSINVSPSITSTYSVTITDSNGCTGTSARTVVVNENPEVTISGNNEFCLGESTELTTTVSGNTFCSDDCNNILLVNWSLDQCNSEGFANQNDYSEFIPNIISMGSLNMVTATNVTRDRGDHSCTPDGTGGIGLCIGSLSSCDPNQYDPINALRFNITISPNELGKLTKLTFREQSPLNWLTTNGSSGVNNYNEKYLIRVYKDGTLVYSKNNILTERTWNLEIFDFTDNPEFTINSTTTFSFELYGYCIVERDGTPGWEIDDVKIYGGECHSSPVVDNVSYLWSNGATTSTVIVTPMTTTSYIVTITDCNGCQGIDEFLVTVNPLPTPSITGDNVICNGESTTLTAAGGSTYIWSNGATTVTNTVNPSATTTYSVTTTDVNGCQGSTSMTVTVNPLPTPSITGDNVICNGESTTLTAAGGSTYVWSNGATTATNTVNPSVTTTYSVTTTDANGCQGSTSMTVTVNPLPTPSITGNNVICNGETTRLTAVGGSTYVWSNGATTATNTVNPSVTTTYSVTTTDANGCQGSTSMTVTVNPQPTPSITGDNVICNGESTTLTAAGGSTYVWSNGATTVTNTVNPECNDYV
ncbi:MAG: hypothetical protein IPN86_01785 [Saprospiraceae bacterium]|nr:hypothetical protein [Saprospiraceae bacterium]